MAKEKWLLVILAVALIATGIYHWVDTAPTWNLYHKEYPMVRSVEEFDSLMLEVEGDVDQNFRVHYPINSAEARDTLDSYLRDPSVMRCFVDAWAWVWEGSNMTPQWAIVRQWRDTWRSFDYAAPETKQAQFCMMGFSPTPLLP